MNNSNGIYSKPSNINDQANETKEELNESNSIYSKSKNIYSKTSTYQYRKSNSKNYYKNNLKSIINNKVKDISSESKSSISLQIPKKSIKSSFVNSSGNFVYNRVDNIKAEDDLGIESLVLTKDSVMATERLYATSKTARKVIKENIKKRIIKNKLKSDLIKSKGYESSSLSTITKKAISKNKSIVSVILSSNKVFAMLGFLSLIFIFALLMLIPISLFGISNIEQSSVDKLVLNLNYDLIESAYSMCEDKNCLIDGIDNIIFDTEFYLQLVQDIENMSDHEINDYIKSIHMNLYQLELVINENSETVKIWRKEND